MYLSISGLLSSRVPAVPELERRWNGDRSWGRSNSRYEQGLVRDRGAMEIVSARLAAAEGMLLPPSGIAYLNKDPKHCQTCDATLRRRYTQRRRQRLLEPAVSSRCRVSRDACVG
jgi:hypothetical protein